MLRYTKQTSKNVMDTTFKDAYKLPKHCLQKPIICNDLPSKFNPTLKRAGAPKRFKCEEVPKATWEQ